jgi:hypothetical protein
MNARDRLQCAAIGVVTLMSTTAAPADSAPPGALWRWVHAADAVVVAQVVSIDVPPEATAVIGDDDDDVDVPDFNSIVRLHVIERWKGEIDSDVAVPLELEEGCPTFPGYVIGEIVVAFLAWDDRDATWQAVDLSCGTVAPSPADLPVYAARVREALALQRKSGMDRVDRIEWLVRCAEDRATRWHGLYELAGTGNAPNGDDDGLRIVPADLLTDEQRGRIVRGFLRDARLDGTISLLLEVLGPYRDDRFDRALVAAVDRELGSDEPDVFKLVAAIPPILTQWGDEKALARMRSPENAHQVDDFLDAMRKVWADAKAKLD